MQSSISLNVAVLWTDVLLVDVSVTKWDFNVPFSAGAMMLKMAKALIMHAGDHNNDESSDDDDNVDDDNDDDEEGDE